MLDKVKGQKEKEKGTGSDSMSVTSKTIRKFDRESRERHLTVQLGMCVLKLPEYSASVWRKVTFS